MHQEHENTTTQNINNLSPGMVDGQRS